MQVAAKLLQFLTSLNLDVSAISRTKHSQVPEPKSGGDLSRQNNTSTRTCAYPTCVVRYKSSMLRIPICLMKQWRKVSSNFIQTRLYSGGGFSALVILFSYCPEGSIKFLLRPFRPLNLFQIFCQRICCRIWLSI